MNQIRIRRKPTTAACALGVAQSAGPGSRTGARGRGRRRACLFGVVAVCWALLVVLASRSQLPWRVLPRS